MTYLKINDAMYPAEFYGRVEDVDWDRRESKIIYFEASYELAIALFHDDVQWSIYNEWTEKEIVIDPDTQEPSEIEVIKHEEYDNSDYSMLGDVTVHPNGYVSVKMGKPTELEIAYELLYGGE